MNFKTILLAATFAGVAVSAQAGSFGVALNQTATSFWSADFDSDFLVGSLLGGAPGVSGTDTITFNDFLAPLPAGSYEVELNFMELTNSVPVIDPIHVTSATLNGIPVSYSGRRAFDIAGTTNPPFVLSLTGYTNAPDVGYHGTITVTAVPEPESYAMFLAGLGLFGTIIRHRKVQQA